MISDQRIKALRRMSDEFLEMIETADPNDIEAGQRIAVLGGALAGVVPELLGEIEHLRGAP